MVGGVASEARKIGNTGGGLMTGEEELAVAVEEDDGVGLVGKERGELGESVAGGVAGDGGIDHAVLGVADFRQELEGFFLFIGEVGEHVGAEAFGVAALVLDLLVELDFELLGKGGIVVWGKGAKGCGAAEDKNAGFGFGFGEIKGFG
jgi:hypothetical protein